MFAYLHSMICVLLFGIVPRRYFYFLASSYSPTVETLNIGVFLWYSAS